MEVEKKCIVTSKNYSTEAEEEEEVKLPGFRFHPTDEELVGFYLRRKVEKRPINIELIKQMDIYKFEPWDLPKSSNMGEKEWFFFCKRGRKYRNSVRPNRVTGYGFWKATGIDRPIYNARGECIGLKKSLVYYRGSAGKGTKTDWMMHEFRLPAENDKSTKHIEAKSIAQEAEVWTLCRIFKRSGSYNKKCVPAEWRNPDVADSQTYACSGDSSSSSISDHNNYIISFGAPAVAMETKPFISGHQHNNNNNQQLLMGSSSSSLLCTTTQAPSLDMNHLLNNIGDYYWDELTSILELDRY